MGLPRRIEGYAIVSREGMICTADGVMPGGLKIDADQRYFHDGLDRADAVANIQNSMLLLAAFMQGRHDLLSVALEDRIHQPFRKEACPLLPKLVQLADTPGVLGVALSGAGPSVLILAENSTAQSLDSLIRQAAGVNNVEVIHTLIAEPDIAAQIPTAEVLRRRRVILRRRHDRGHVRGKRRRRQQ